MRFCEAFRNIENTRVTSIDRTDRALEAVFRHDKYHDERWGSLSAARYLFEVDAKQWKHVTGFSNATRNFITSIVIQEKYPTTVFIEKYGWAIFYCQGSIRDFFFSLFKSYSDLKVAPKIKKRQRLLDIRADVDARRTEARREKFRQEEARKKQRRLQKFSGRASSYK